MRSMGLRISAEARRAAGEFMVRGWLQVRFAKPIIHDGGTARPEGAACSCM